MSESVSRQVSPALERAYQFVAWLIPTLDRFPRRQKFLPGDRIESTALDVLEGLVEATYTRNRGRVLEAQDNLQIFESSSSFPRKRESRNRGLDGHPGPPLFAGVTSAKLRFLFRLSTELQLLDQRRYEHASRGIDEIGRLVGGWIRAHRDQAAS